MPRLDAAAGEPIARSSRPAPLWRKALPYAGTIIIFALIFWRVPITAVARALGQAPVLKFFGVFLPYSAFYFLIDSYCLTWVVRRFNAPLRWRDIVPIRASMYVLAMVNTSLAQGGVAYYLHRKGRIAFLEALSSILFIALLEIYQLFLFSTVGVIFYFPTDRGQAKIIGILRIVYVIAWMFLAMVMIFFAVARRNARLRGWIENRRGGPVARTFMLARPLDYLAVIAIKTPNFLGSLITQYFALSLYGIAIPFLKLVLFLPLIFIAAALPIAVAHLGTSQAAWLLFFSVNTSEVKILAYSIAAQFTFMLCNALIGLCFVPRASRELTEISDASA